jgi:hypothetical protein
MVCGRRLIKRHVYDYLIINQYPTPKEYELSTVDYFISVMDNKECDTEIRIKAATQVGIFAAYSGTFERQRLKQISIAAEDAIKDYRIWIAAADTKAVHR